MHDLYIIKDGKKLRCGYTTGSCAAAAAKAAATMLITGETIDHIEIDTPAGIQLKLWVYKASITGEYASCCVIKDAGDDPDVTDHMEIYAHVSKREDGVIKISGGEGIGVITRKGFWGEAGEAAINPIPRKMIANEVSKIADSGFDVTIYAPKGADIAKRTFNANIGIEGGISIIGTSGIVEPMSDDALKKTIYLEIDAALESGAKELVLFPGNYGANVAKSLALKGAKIKVSNFIGDALLYIHEKGLNNIILVGHVGKLCKLSIGAFNTHSKLCDVRIEAFVYYLALAAAPYELISSVNACVTSEEAVKLLQENGYHELFDEMSSGCEHRIRRYLKNDSLDIKVIMYSMDYGILGGKHD
jgi:cobalt-precorrin-5B (C1)-methyltransferase